MLDIGTVDFVDGSDLAYTLYLPTYTAAAHHHGRIDGDLRARIAEAEEFAARDLPWALGRGNRLTGAERAAVVARYAELTGLDPGYVDRADLRVDLASFTTELLRDQGRQLGRLDLRFTSWPDHGNVGSSDEDPSYRALVGPYAAAANGYLRSELGYRTDLSYHLLTGQVHPWSYKEFEGRSVESASALASAMRANPHLRVHVSCGYFDGATPHFAAEHVFAHLRVPRAELERVTWALLRGGPHDVRARAQPAPAVGRPRRLRAGGGGMSPARGGPTGVVVRDTGGAARDPMAGPSVGGAP